MKDKVEQILQTALYRYECPSVLALNDYQMKILSQQEQQRVEVHLAQCPHCQAELQRLITFLAMEAVTSNWQEAAGFIWQQVREKQAIVIRFLQGAMSSTPLLPLAVKGGKLDRESTQIIRQIILSPEDTGNLDIEVIIWQEPQSPLYCQVTIRIQDPNRWPELGGVMVQAVAHTWQMEGTTNNNGEVVFEGLLKEWLGELSIEVRP